MSEQAPREERDWHTVLPDDLRPNGNGRTCFYCPAPLGEKHREGCVIPWGSSWYIVTLCNNDTGAVRRYREDSVWNDGAEYMWSEGNFACDCNRHMMFQRARGEEPEWDTPCGDTRYTVLNIELPDGTLVYP